MSYVLSVLVSNKPGVLSRVIGLISRRGFNIESLSVGPVEDPTMSRITIVLEADNEGYEQITKQLHKLIDVHKISDLTGEEVIERELVLFKVHVLPEQRGEVIGVVSAFHAEIVAANKNTLIIEVVGDDATLHGIEDLLRGYGIKEMVRTGTIAMSRGVKE